MNNKSTKLLAIFALAVSLCMIPRPAMAQGTALTATTISSAITSASASQVTLASATGVTIAGNNGQFNTVLWIGKELMGVKSLVSGTTYSVQRGLQGTRPLTYLSGAAVLLGSPTGNFMSADYFAEVVPGTACVSTNSPTLPHVYVKSGHRFDCTGVSGTQQWMLTSGPDSPVLGTAVASATTIAATGTIFHVTGTTAVVTITVPNGWAPGNSIYLIPDAVFTFTAAGNVALAGSAVVNKILILTWSGSKWVPSYIA